MDDTSLQLIKLRKTLNKSGYQALEIVHHDSVVCDKCEDIIEKYHKDCDKSKLTNDVAVIKRDTKKGLASRIREAKEDIQKCKKGRIEFIRQCCKRGGKPAADLGHIAWINVLQDIEDNLESELELLKAERKERKNTMVEIEEEVVKRGKKVVERKEHRVVEEEDYKKSKKAEKDDKKEDKKRKKKESEKLRKLRKLVF
jgi:hypothetical protein